MKMKRIGVFLAVCICSVSMLTGCSADDAKSKITDAKSKIVDTSHKIFGKTQEVTEDTSKENTVEKSGKTVDESVEKPSFTASLGGTIQISMGSTFGLSSPAQVSNGTISYQWYTNNVNSNGGGTPVAGETEDHIFVDTSGPSHKFYYVVVTNEVDGKINRNTSETQEVIVWDIGTWQADEEGNVRYMMIDGTYPKSTWFLIDDNFCYVNENGYRATGLVDIGGTTYYFSDEGYLQRNTTGPNGETVDENGVAHPVEQPAEEQPAEQPAEEQPAEQPAEEQPTE